MYGSISGCFQKQKQRLYGLKNKQNTIETTYRHSLSKNNYPPIYNYALSGRSPVLQRAAICTKWTNQQPLTLLAFDCLLVLTVLLKCCSRCQRIRGNHLNLNWCAQRPAAWPSPVALLPCQHDAQVNISH